MKTFTACAIIAATASALNANLDKTDNAYMQFVAVHGRNIKSAEEFNFRRNLFKQSDDIIRGENKKNLSYKLGHNHMSDWTEAEYKQLLGYKPELRAFPKQEHTLLNATDLPAEVDWVKDGAVTPIKDQGQCGSCWAFSTIGGMEGAHFRKSKKLESFSEQLLVDCDKVDHGCGGGLMDNGFKFLETHDVELEKDYPYTAKGGACAADKHPKTDVEVTTFTDVKPAEPDQLKAALAIQPVSVAIEADKSMFRYYASGVLDSPSCGTHLDHGVLAVGYGKRADGVEYYVVKNSWNTTWGDKGFIKLRIVPGDGTCGIQMQASYPTVSA